MCCIKVDVFKKFAKFAGKHLSQSLSINKVAGLRSATLWKKRLQRRCFPVNFAKVLRTPFLQNIPNDCFCLFLYNQKAGKENKTKIQLFHLFRNNFFPKNTGRGGRAAHLICLKKIIVCLQNLMFQKCYFQS